MPVRSLHQSIARVLPDLPRWIEVRDLLLSDDCEIFGLEEQAGLSFVLCERHGNMLFVIGRPSVAALRGALRDLGQSAMLIAPPEQASWLMPALPGWTRKRIMIHTLPDHEQLPVPSGDQVKFLDASTLDRLPVPAELFEELKDGAAHSEIAATWIDEQPVSFCYAASETEAWWDIAIDTLPEYRRRGYAALCVAHMIRHMHRKGKQPVWQAVEDNPASWRLAQKLGFVGADELALFEFQEHDRNRRTEQNG